MRGGDPLRRSAASARDVFLALTEILATFGISPSALLATPLSALSAFARVVILGGAALLSSLRVLLVGLLVFPFSLLTWLPLSRLVLPITLLIFFALSLFALILLAAVFLVRHDSLSSISGEMPSPSSASPVPWRNFRDQYTDCAR